MSLDNARVAQRANPADAHAQAISGGASQGERCIRAEVARSSRAAGTSTNDASHALLHGSDVCGGHLLSKGVGKTAAHSPPKSRPLSSGRPRTVAIIALSLCFASAFCGCARLDHGKVVSKSFEPAHTTTWLMPMTFDGGKTYSYIPQTDNIPDRWWLTIQDGERQASWEVSKETYDRFDEGDAIDFRPKAEVQP